MVGIVMVAVTVVGASMINEQIVVSSQPAELKLDKEELGLEQREAVETLLWGLERGTLLEGTGRCSESFASRPYLTSFIRAHF